MDHQFTREAFIDFQYWQQNDLKKIDRIKKLILDIKEHHPSAIGKPERLKYNKLELWSRRIDREHRLVYSVENDMLTVYSCRFHYRWLMYPQKNLFVYY